MRCLSLIGIDDIWQLSFRCLLKVPTIYLLPKLQIRPYKSRFTANSSSITTTKLSILLTFCLTAIKNHVVKYCTTIYERNSKKFGLLEIQVKFLIN